MKKAVLIAIIAVLASAALAFADCGVCGAGEAKAAGEGSSHDAEHLAEAKAGKGHMYKIGEEGQAMMEESGSMAGESGSMKASGKTKEKSKKMGKSNISTKAKAKEASSY